MTPSLPLGLALAGILATYSTVKVADHMIYPSSYEGSVTRLQFCSRLLSEPTLGPGPSGDDGARTEAPEADAGRVFVGDEGQMDFETIALLLNAERRSEFTGNVEGEMPIREALARIQGLGRGMTTRALESDFKNRTVYDLFVASLYPVELGAFATLLADFSAGRRLNQTALAVVPATEHQAFSRYALRLGANHLFRSSEKQMFCWHQLSWDKNRRAPVWRFGVSEM